MEHLEAHEYEIMTENNNFLFFGDSFSLTIANTIHSRPHHSRSEVTISAATASTSNANGDLVNGRWKKPGKGRYKC